MSFSPSSFANFAPQSKLDGILGRVGPPIMHTMDDQSAEDFNDYYYTPYHDLGLQEYTPYGVNPLWRGPDSSQLQLSGEHIPEVKPMSPLSPPFTPTFMSSSSVPDTPSSTPSIHTYANSPGSGVASPPTATSSTAIHSSFSRLDRDASTFVPRKKITIKTTSGEEVKFQQAPRNPILTMQAPVNIRIESETEKFRRLVKEQEQQTGNLTPKVLLNGTEDKSQQKRLEKREKKMQRKAERRAVQDLVKSLIPDMSNSVNHKGGPEPQLPLPVKVRVEGSPQASPPFEQKRADLLAQIIANVSSGGTFTDETLTFHSRRRIGASGGAYSPHRLDVNTSILRAASEKFNQIFNGSFKDEASDDYADDSDLDWDDDDVAPPPSVHNFSCLDGIMISDVGIDIHENAQPPNDSSQSSHPLFSNLRQLGDSELPGAYRTWKAMNIYLVTDEIKFSPLRSEKKQSEVCTGNDNKSTVPCSPKSMYRLAKKLDLFSLTQCSFDAISQSFGANNIIEELFSDFTWRYPDILRLAVDVYYEHCDKPQVIEDLNKTHQEISSGKRPHAPIILNAINQKLVKMAKQLKD